MRTTRLTLLILEQTEETPEPTRPVITTTGELVRARPIRKFIPEPVEQFAPGTALAELQSWLRRVS